MPSILTITLNPAIDKSTGVDRLLPEKKLKCDDPRFEPGGGGINVSRAIKRLGGDSRALYLAGGYTGKYFSQLLEKESIAAMPVDIEGHTRENLIVFDRSDRKQYRFGMPGPNISKDEWNRLLGILQHCEDVNNLVASGSVPDGIPDDCFCTCARIAREKNIPFILDSSGIPLKKALSEKLFLIKPNLTELASLEGKAEVKPEEAGVIAGNIIRKGLCENIVVSLGSNGALLVTEKQVTSYKPPVLQIESTVGAGDSMVAGIVFSLSKGASITEAVRYGVACGSAATLNPGTELCHLSDVDSLLEKIVIS